MDNHQPLDQQKPLALKRVLGLFAIFAAAIGGAASQTVFVGLLNAAGIGGGTYLLALFIGLVIAITYVISFSELAVMMPKAGGISTYTAVSFGHFPAIVVTILSFTSIAVFGGPAEMLLMDHIMQVSYPGIIAHPSLILLSILAILNILGIDIFSGTQRILTYIMLVSLVVIGLYGFGYGDPKGIAMPVIITGFTSINSNLFSLIMLAVWPLVGLELASTLAQETRKPEKNIPGGLFMALGALFIVYFVYTFAAIKVMPAKQLATSDIPHYLFAQVMFGTGGKIAVLIMGIATTSVGMNGVMAALSRLLFGMGHHHQLPPIFKKLHPKFRTPWFSILVIYVIQAATLLVFGNIPGFIIILIISSSSAFLMIYIIAHIDVIILHFKYPKFKRPFKTPLYPLPQVIGIIGMVYALIQNSPSADLAKKVYVNAVIMVGIAITYAFFWVKFSMKKKLFEAEPIDEALAD